MLQKQYLNSKLNNKHINNILENYKIKYSGIKNEIESKINDMIKLIVKDISGFLENIEETAVKKAKLNSYEKMKNELDTIRNQLKMKIYNEHKTKNELDLLTQENSLLKVKIKSLNEKIINLTNNNSSNNNIKTKSPSIRKTIKYKPLLTPNLNIRTFHKSTKMVNQYAKKYSAQINMKLITDRNNFELNGSQTNNTGGILPKKEKFKKNGNKTERNESFKNDLNIICLKKSSNIYKRKNKKIYYSKFINNRNNNSNNNINVINDSNKSNIYINKRDSKQVSPGPILSAISNIIIDNKNEKINDRSSRSKSNPKKKDTHNYSPDNSYELIPEISPDYEEIGKEMNSIFDEELKNLEKDEENIKNILKQINYGNIEDFILNKNSGDSKFINSN